MKRESQFKSEQRKPLPYFSLPLPGFTPLNRYRVTWTLYKTLLGRDASFLYTLTHSEAGFISSLWVWLPASGPDKGNPATALQLPPLSPTFSSRIEVGSLRGNQCQRLLSIFHCFDLNKHSVGEGCRSGRGRGRGARSHRCTVAPIHVLTKTHFVMVHLEKNPERKRRSWVNTKAGEKRELI